jgi:hypothetical protein
MAMNFPNSPSDGDTHEVNGKTFIYNATKGIWSVSGAVQLISVSDNAPTSPVNGDMWFNSTDTNTYMWYSDGDSNQWIQLNGTGTVVQNITNNVFDTPTITSVSPANYSGTDATTFTIIGTNFNVGTIVTFIDSGGNEYNASTTSVITQGELTAVTPQAFTAAEGPLDVKVTTGGGAATVTATDMIQTGGSPVWTTAAGNLGDFNKDAVPNPVVDLDATDPDGDPILYSIQSGATPAGTSIDGSTGAISGDFDDSGLSGDTTYSFTAGVNDTAGNMVTRNFNIIVRDQLSYFDISSMPGLLESDQSVNVYGGANGWQSAYGTSINNYMSISMSNDGSHLMVGDNTNLFVWALGSSYDLNSISSPPTKVGYAGTNGLPSPAVTPDVVHDGTSTHIVYGTWSGNKGKYATMSNSSGGTMDISHNWSGDSKTPDYGAMHDNQLSYGTSWAGEGNYITQGRYNNVYVFPTASQWNVDTGASISGSHSIDVGVSGLVDVDAEINAWTAGVTPKIWWLQKSGLDLYLRQASASIHNPTSSSEWTMDGYKAFSTAWTDGASAMRDPRLHVTPSYVFLLTSASSPSNTIKVKRYPVA